MPTINMLSSADKVLEGNSILDYGKMQETYQMTEGGSFYMPNAVYQKPEGKEESVVDQLDTQMDMSATNRKNQMVVVSNTTSSTDSLTP